MAELVGATLSLALGIAISPLPIIAAILMLFSPRARSTAVSFLLGWVIGITVAVIVFVLLSGLLGQSDPDTAKPVAGVIQIILGALLLLLAIRQWRSRPRPGDKEKLPGWMNAIDTITPGRAFALAVLLAAVNPKNLLLAASAGLTIGSARQPAGITISAVAIFVIVASLTVAVPVIAFLVASDRMRRPLDSLRAWLIHNNATVMAVVLLTLGTVLIGKGIGQF